jgi:hypothetical protein
VSAYDDRILDVEIDRASRSATDGPEDSNAIPRGTRRDEHDPSAPRRRSRDAVPPAAPTTASLAADSDFVARIAAGPAVP